MNLVMLILLVMSLVSDTLLRAAALRASLGHPDPFPLAHVEVGNEVCRITHRFSISSNNDHFRISRPLARLYHF